jgi:DNA-binding response OmpR family regulator
MAKEKILIVDDEKEIADLIEIHLLNEGYNHFNVLELLARVSLN